ncbi:hypothetical protein VTK56DRAFT_5027 [Thermocarpiscus australiensis]
MELNSGDDLIMLKESLQSQYSYSQSADSPLSILDADEYARCHDLTIDSRLLNWPRLLERDQFLASTIAELGPGQLVEGVQLQECLFRPIIPTPEQWQVPVKSLQILQQVCRGYREDEVANLRSQQCLSGTLKWKSLKSETPALRSDHGIDCRRLARRIKAFLKEPLPDHRLPLHPTDVDKGEGLEFPSIASEMDKEQMSTVETEQLEVNRDALVYLMQALKSNWTESQHLELVESSSAYQGVGAREHLTPPLSPLAQRFPEYFVPDEETCEIPEPSDPCSRLSADIEAAESRIFETDFEFWAEALGNDVSPERHDDLDVSEMIRAGEFKPTDQSSSPQPVPRDMKVEVPLVCDVERDDPREPVRVLAPEDLAGAKALVLSSDTLSGSDGAELVNFFQGRATALMRGVEQEKLQPLDATARVPVPVMDFSIPVPEWDERLWEVKEMFRWIRENTDVDWHGPKWTHNRAAEQRMVWTPLAHMKEKKLVSEQIDVDHSTLGLFLNRSRDCEVLSRADYVYKRPGLAILRVDDDDADDEDYITPLDSSRQPARSQSQADVRKKPTVPSLTENRLSLHRASPNLTAAAMSPPADLATLLTGRKRLIEETIQRRQSSGRRNGESTATPEISASDIIDPTLIPSTNVLRGFMREYTDFAPLVDNFVEMNFPKKPKLSRSSFFSPPSTTPLVAHSKATEEAAMLMPPPPKPTPALAPDITPPRIPPRVVISRSTSKLITNHLQKLLPGIEFIWRDYDKHRPPGWVPGLRSPSADEADIVVSPATGILLTTMVQLRQKPLPGQTKASATMTDLCRVTQNVAARHERLVVVVSEGNKHSETAGPLSQSDARALAEFQGFTAGLRTEVQVLYVGGGVETLAKWVAATICNYAAEALPVRDLLLPVETFWEVFLRRAGMNVYGAQVVLGMLKVPENWPAVGGEGGQLYGLPLFVMMPQQRRIDMFNEAFGGRKVLDRVGETIDEPWGQHVVDDGRFQQDFGMAGGGRPRGIA